MRELPILFSTPMVQAILENRKTMTRRMQGIRHVNNDPDDWQYDPAIKPPFSFKHKTYGFITTSKPRYQVGDQLWVKETFSFAPLTKETKPFYPDLSDYIYKAGSNFISIKWKSSLFMPKAAARIWLEVTGVRCERLQDISEADAHNEGVAFGKSTMGNCYYDYLSGGYNIMTTARKSFFLLWRDIHKLGRWDYLPNPWVFIYEFKRIEK